MLYKERKVNKEKKLQMAPVSFKEGRGGESSHFVIGVYRFYDIT
jgi:hypothetical protein